MPKKPPATLGIIYRMPLEDLHPHPLNPYGVRDDPAMQELVGSVKENGVLIPAIARPRKEGGYEMISGHRRKYACEQLGQDTMPVMVLNLKDDDAIIRMIDSNIQRENILPSERAKAYKLKMEAIKQKAGRPQKLTGYFLDVHCIKLGFSQNLVLPEPEPPIISTFLFRAVQGSAGRLFMVRLSVWVRMMLFSKVGST